MSFRTRCLSGTRSTLLPTTSIFSSALWTSARESKFSDQPERVKWPVRKETIGRARQQHNLHCRAVHTVLAAKPSSSISPDALVVLGGGLTETAGVPLWGQRRLNTAYNLYNEHGCPVLCLGGGTPHKPAMLSDTGHVIHEASAYASYLKKKGIPAKNLWKEVSSYDTVGNAYFALAIHAVPAGWRNLAVITSAFHMPRSQAIFSHCAKVAAAASNPAHRLSLEFHACSDEGVFEPDVLAARHQREHESLQAWLHNSQRLKTWQQLHAFVHQEHTCYSVAHQGTFGQPDLDDIDDKALASY